MRRTYRYDEKADMFYEVGDNFFEERKENGPNVISDTMGNDVNGLRAMYRRDKKHFDSKSRYRADVKAHGLREVGNDDPASKPATQPKDCYGQRVKQAWDQFDGNHNGMADRVRREEHITKWRRENG